MKNIIEQIGYTIVRNYGDGYALIKLSNPLPAVDEFPMRHLAGVIYLLHQI